MPRLEREARSPTGQIFLIFLLVIGGERGRARTRVHDYYVSPSKRISSFSRTLRFRLLLIRRDNVLSIFLSPDNIFLSIAL